MSGALIVSVKESGSLWYFYINTILILSLSFFCFVLFFYQRQFFLIGINLMQGLTATMRYGVTRKKSTKRLKHTGNPLRSYVKGKHSIASALLGR